MLFLTKVRGALTDGQNRGMMTTATTPGSTTWTGLATAAVWTTRPWVSTAWSGDASSTGTAQPGIPSSDPLGQCTVSYAAAG